jgi:4-hydroxymandelate synthase
MEHLDELPFSGMVVDHVELYVEDAWSRACEFVDSWGFTPVSALTSPGPGGAADEFSVTLRQGKVVFVVTEPRSVHHEAHHFLEEHGDGVADIVLGVASPEAACRYAVEAGAEPWTAGSQGTNAGYAVRAFGDVRHSFVRLNPSTETLAAPGGEGGYLARNRTGVGICAIDHLAVCLPTGKLSAAVGVYESAFGMRSCFAERIVVGSQAMLSEVVQNEERTLTLTLIQPDPSADSGQIDAFLDGNGGAGVQHVALACEDVVRTVSALAGNGVDFLDTPEAYYQPLRDRVTLRRHGLDELRELSILADEDQDGHLFQIFARSTCPRRTLFFEVIERLGARTFGSANIKALYEAVEAQRLREPLTKSMA